MAGSSSLTRAGKRVSERLASLNCPVLEGINLNDTDAVIELLCTPGLDRLQFLEWLCVSCCPPLKRKFEELQFNFVKASAPDPIIQQMTCLGHNLGLCSAEDFDLFQGQASPYRQLVLMDQMLSGVQQFKQITEEGVQCGTSVCAWNSRLLTEVLNDPHLRCPKTLQCVPSSLDAHRLLMRAQPSREPKTLSVPPPESLEKELLELTEDLENTNHKLQETKQRVASLGSTEESDESVIQTLKQALSDFHQLITAFSLAFKHEFDMQKPAPQLCNFGPLCQSVHQLLTSCINELAGLAEVTNMEGKLEAIVKNLEEDAITWDGGEVATLVSRVDKMKKKYVGYLDVFQSSAE
uniref:HAUS augmin-like complex subunit 7 n=1 Tax=Callorhinchus milii TaxID=7868 RepID=A0A4W3HQB8_CALMI|eukprot:gi/632986242/ref/XP_007910126.1/ PREDICTED: HAUS augmin-like complex subunit 7 [Callorhinchus milii]